MASSGRAALGGNTAWISQRMTPPPNVAADAKFKKYAQAVEKCLVTFDNVHEWADFIAFLGKLLKTLQGYMQFKEIPKKLIVSKRLAQCLNPALPTGVHQRALDVYAHILAVLGTEGLKRDLHLWSSGLFPFFEYAATAVKPTLLGLYDTHYLPLQQSLRPITKAFILALLPGVEEENGEFFDQVLQLLDRLSSTIGQAFFLQNLWLSMLTNQVARGPALHYLARRLPKLSGDEDIAAIIGGDVGLMIRAFSAALEDDNLLVRRATLDLLLQSVRLDGSVVKRAQEEDRIILMGAATGVVLRRDSALNRRLYTWLLGTAEDSDSQMQYLKANSLDLLCTTLKRELSTSNAVPDAKPLKMFLSLLDKWEIGSQLTDALILETLKSIVRTLEDHRDDSDYLLAASSLYEAAEPRMVWKHLFSAIQDDLLGISGNQESIKLVRSILQTFKSDEEMQKIHLPICFSGILELMAIMASEDSSTTNSAAAVGCLYLLQDMLTPIASSALLLPLGEQGTEYKRPYLFASSFYGTKPLKTVAELSRSPQAFVSATEDLISIISSNVIFLSDKRKEGKQNKTALSNPSLEEALSTSTKLMNTLFGKLPDKLKANLSIKYSPDEWRDTLLDCLDQACSFVLVDNAISLAIQLGTNTALSPKLEIDKRPIVGKMMGTLLRFLRPHYVAYHVRTVKLIWSLEAATTYRHVEALIAESLIVRSGLPPYDAYEAFGVLWRLSDDTSLPGFKFRVPMFNVLDTMRSEDPALKRLGETWMRCSLKSYMRILDPILYELMDPTIRRIPGTFSWKGMDLRIFSYDKPFDTSRVAYLLDSLAATVRFGGQGLAKVSRTTSLKKGIHPDVYKRAFSMGILRSDDSYMDVLIEILLRLLQSEPKPELLPMIGPANARIQSHSIDLLQTIISRGDMELDMLESIEATVVAKLFSCIHTTRLDLQPKLLHILHSVILASSTIPHVYHGKSKVDAAIAVAALESSTLTASQTDEKTGKKLPSGPNPLLAQTLIDGISETSNRSILQHWLDFILTTLPQFSQSLQYLCYPICSTINRLLRDALNGVERAEVKGTADNMDQAFIMSDSEFVMLLHALERLVLQGISKGELVTGEVVDDVVPLSAVEKEHTGLLGFVSNVLSPDGVSLSNDSLSSRSPGYRSLHDATQILYSVWIASAWTPPPDSGPTTDSILLIYNRARQRCRRALEKLFRAQSAEVMESLVECWFEDSLRGSRSGAAFELVDLLTSSAQTAVHMLCESINMRINAVPEKTRKVAVNPNVTDYVLLLFLEDYIGRLEGPIAVQVWNRFVTLAKDITANVYSYKLQVFPMLRCVTRISEIIVQTTAIEDKKVRKDVQETYGKLVDTCILISGRSFEQGNWMKIPTTKELTGRLTPIPRSHSETPLPEKDMGMSSAITEQKTKAPWGPELIDQINEFLLEKGISNFRRFLADTDRITTVSTNLVYYIIAPAMKSKSGSTLDVDDTVLGIVKELSKIQAAARAWRTPVQEAFNDTRFFECSPEVAVKCQPIITALMDTDKTVFSDLLAKIGSAPSANIFTNREYEMLVRSLNLRRLSYVILSGTSNKYLTQLPSIQEKLVDVLKSSAAPVVQAEVYLCMRVLLCRLSAHNLVSFWPTILTELFRVLEQVFEDVPADGSDDLALLLSACKFLDLLLILQTQEFQIQQWMFVTDTVDAVYRPEEWSPESLLDQLAEMVTDLPEPKSTDGKGKETQTISFAFASEFTANQNLRRPLLGFTKQVGSIRDLLPFFSQISMSAYESVYGMGTVDYEAIERGLMAEMFQAGAEDVDTSI